MANLSRNYRYGMITQPIDFQNQIMVDSENILQMTTTTFSENIWNCPPLDSLH